LFEAATHPKPLPLCFRYAYTLLCDQPANGKRHNAATGRRERTSIPGLMLLARRGKAWIGSFFRARVSTVSNDTRSAVDFTIEHDAHSAEFQHRIWDRAE
jgi:hypothetical protein